MSEDYQRAEQENLRNPKNRFLGLFCHAKDVDNSWGCNWSFPTGVIMFSVVIGLASFFDIYFIAKADIFGETQYSGMFKFWVVLKIFSDLISFAGIGMACYGVFAQNLKYSVISYYVVVLSLVLNTIFLICSIYYMFVYPKMVLLYLIPWGILEFGLVLFCWILFCNQVYLGRQLKIQATQQGY
jgi:hypothetical protein